MSDHMNPLPGGIQRCHTDDPTFKELFVTLKKWRSCNPAITRLDGWTNALAHGKSWVVFLFNNKRFHLNADTKSEAIARFLVQYKDAGHSLNTMFVIKGNKLRFRNGNSQGWYCYEGGARGTFPMGDLKF